MKDLRAIAIFAGLMASVPLFVHSGVVLNLCMMALFATLLSQSWNILGGFGGQFSFGHALFFGMGAYTQGVFQIQFGLNPWLCLVLAMGSSAMLGLLVGGLSFRYGLKGSYFALITLAFAEVFRILALSANFTGAGVGLMLPLSESVGNMQFSSRVGFIWLMLFWVVCALLITSWLRRSRLGAYLQAVRDNEDAAQALGVDPFQVKWLACGLSAALMGVAGAFYLQVFQYIDPALAFGPHTSISALVGAIVGGMGTLWGPVLGAFALEILSELTRNLFGELPGINMVIYGALLILIMVFLPRGFAGIRWQGPQRDVKRTPSSGSIGVSASVKGLEERLQVGDALTSGAESQPKSDRSKVQT
jgi:branched-chain amino acid transport system permease protein